jgi:hypothetical protein
VARTRLALGSAGLNLRSEIGPKIGISPISHFIASLRFRIESGSALSIEGPPFGAAGIATLNGFSEGFPIQRLTHLRSDAKFVIGSVRKG